MNIIKAMKEKIAKSGASKKDILYFGKDSKHRIRFIQELDAGYQFQFHNDWSTSIFELCKDPEDHENCKLCEEGIAIQDNFAWSVWDYDTNTVKLILFKATGVSPVPAFIEMFEEFGTMLDRDYSIKKVGQGQGSSFVVTPLDKERFKNKKAKPFSRNEVKDILEKAWPSKDIEQDDEDDDEEEVVEKKSSKKKSKKKVAAEDLLGELSMKELKEIAYELGMSKKEVKSFDDEEELIEELVGNYEEEDLIELIEDMENEDEDDDEDEDE